MVQIDDNMLSEWRYTKIENDKSCAVLSLKFLKMLDEDEFSKLYEIKHLVGMKHSEIINHIQSVLQNEYIIEPHTLQLDEIDRLLKSKYATTIAVKYHGYEFGHIAVLAKNAFGQLVFIDPQVNLIVTGINEIRKHFLNISRIQVYEKRKYRNVSKKQRLKENADYVNDNMIAPLAMDFNLDDVNVPGPGKVNPKKHSRNENIIRKIRETSSTLSVEGVKKNRQYRIPTKINTTRKGMKKGTRKSGFGTRKYR